MNFRRLAPVLSLALILGLWGGVFLKWGRGGPAAEASTDRPGSDKEVQQKIDSLKTSVLGKNEETRGQKVYAPQIKPPRSTYNYTSREICMQMKLTYPDKYKDMDCGSDKFSSPNTFKEE